MLFKGGDFAPEISLTLKTEFVSECWRRARKQRCLFAVGMLMIWRGVGEEWLWYWGASLES